MGARLGSLPGLILAIAMLGDGAVGAAAEPVRIGVSLGLTGQYSQRPLMVHRPDLPTK